MLDITKLLDEIKAFPYREVEILTPHTGLVEFVGLALGAKVTGPSGIYMEIPGTTIAFIERERNKKPIRAVEKGEVVALRAELTGRFMEAGVSLARIRHYLSKKEVLKIILNHVLFLFRAPERAKYYFTPEVDLKVKASGQKTVWVQDGMELFIVSRMKREVPLLYHGPEGVIYAVYFQNNVNVDTNDPLISVCPPEQFSLIEDLVARIQTEWKEQS
ncbi:conserved hypothetical protein [Desulfovibrionales bacterium]